MALCAIVAIIVATAAYATGENVIASKKYTDDTFQTKISTGNVLLYDDDEDGVYDADYDLQVPGLVAYDSTTGGLNGKKIGILDFETVNDDEGTLSLYSYDGGGYGAEMDNFVPTVRAVAEELQNIWNNIQTLYWTNTQTAAVNNYSTTFDDTTNNWPSDDSGNMVTGRSLANGLALKQTKIPAGTSGDVVTYTGTAGSVGSTAVASAATYDQGALTNGSAIANVTLVETKQNTISTGNVFLYDDDGDGVYDAEDDDIQVPGLVAYDSTTGGLNGTKIGILDQETIMSHEGSLSTYSYDGGGHGAEMDNFVPTVRAVAEGLSDLYINKQDTIPKSGYGRLGGGKVYNTNAASNSQSWLNANVKGTGLVTRTATDGQIGERKIFESTDVANYHAAALSQNEKDIQDISIPTVGAMMSAITNGTPKITWSATQTAAVNNYSTTFDGTTNNWVATDSGKLVDGSALANAVALKQNTIPANNATTYPNGSVVTYGATAGTPGQVAIASAATYNQQTGALENGTQIANIAAVDTRQKKKVCAGWPDSVAVADRTDANCWLWELPD